MKRQWTETFDELIKKYYGAPLKLSRKNVSDTNELFSYYYGAPKKRHHRKKHHHAVPAVRHDDGEVLQQNQGSSEYVVSSASGTEPLQEYVVSRPASIGRFSASRRARSFSDEVVPSQEYRIDVLQPLSDAPALDGSASPTAAYVSHLDSGTLDATPSAQSPDPASQLQNANATEDDFIADMKAILSGQATYDAEAKQTVPKGEAANGKGASNGSPAPPIPTANEHDIFERIADSMRHANAYDLGTIELQNRFEQFNEELDQEEVAAKEKVKTVAASAAGYGVGDSEFLQDMESIRARTRPVAPYSSATSMDKWDRIASEVFGASSYDDYLANLRTCKFLGQTVANVHQDVVQTLSVVEQDLASSQGAGYTAPTVSSTLRKKKGIHGLGMAIDFDVLGNPYVLNEHGEQELDREFVVAYDHIAEFMLGNSPSVLRKLKSGRSAFGSGTIADVYDALKAESDAMVRYFSLMADDAALASYLAQEWQKNHSGPALAAADVKAQMVEDYEVLGGKTALGDKRPTGGKGDRPFAPVSGGGAGDPANGFLNLPREFVIAMTDAGFAWGAIDIAGEPGDMQHFDLRLRGNGAKAYGLLLKYQ